MERQENKHVYRKTLQWEDTEFEVEVTNTGSFEIINTINPSDMDLFVKWFVKELLGVTEQSQDLKDHQFWINLGNRKQGDEFSNEAFIQRYKKPIGFCPDCDFETQLRYNPRTDEVYCRFPSHYIKKANLHAEQIK